MSAAIAVTTEHPFWDKSPSNSVHVMSILDMSSHRSVSNGIIRRHGVRGGHIPAFPGSDTESPFFPH